MSDEKETYCRLCAEPTPKDQLISPEEDVAISSKIVTKMLWINVDITTSSGLPTTICFSCFDLLERTWSFLHNVRTAQEKLSSILLPKNRKENSTSSSEIKPDKQTNAGKPVNKNWKEFRDTKLEIKVDPDNNLEVITTIDPNSLLNLDNIYSCSQTVKIERIKNEADQDNTMDDEGFNTSDSDLPLCSSVKKKKVKKKQKIKYDSEISTEDLLKNETEAIPIDISTLTTTWDEYSCRCAKCDALFKNVTSLRLHSVQIHSSCSVFKCAECGKVFANYKSFINHARKHKKCLRYCCEYCNKQFAYIKKHINSSHGDICLNTCQNCGAMFENEELLQDHLIFYGKRYKKTRQRSKEYDLKCQDCNKEFKSRSNLQQHRLVHTERSREFSCHVCGKMFFTKGTLGTHMNTHEDMKPFKCEFCPMAFRARGNLQSHISLHSGAKPFVCEQCGKSFRVKRHLKSHSIVHTDLMPYICEYCNKPFRFKTRLNLHLRQHTGAKPYTCVYCHRDFTNGSNYKKHMKRRHNIDTSRKRYNVVHNQNIEGEISSVQS